MNKIACLLFFIASTALSETQTDIEYARVGEHVLKLDLPAGVSRESLRDLGLSLLKEVADVEADPLEA